MLHNKFSYVIFFPTFLHVFLHFYPLPGPPRSVTINSCPMFTLFHTLFAPNGKSATTSRGVFFWGFCWFLFFGCFFLFFVFPLWLLGFLAFSLTQATPIWFFFFYFVSERPQELFPCVSYLHFLLDFFSSFTVLPRSPTCFLRKPAFTLSPPVHSTILATFGVAVFDFV